MAGTSESHVASPSRVAVMKSAVMKTETTPSSSRIGAMRSSAVAASVNVAGPPTGDPTLNFIALGLGVFSVTTPICASIRRTSERSGVRS
jgi:hypothetical protein